MVLHKWLRPLAVVSGLTVLTLGLAAQDAPKPADSAPAANPTTPSTPTTPPPAQEVPTPADSAPAAKPTTSTTPSTPPPAQEVPTSGAAKAAEQVAAHWSRWDYPKEVNVPEGQSLHIVQKGDTFWALAGHYLDNVWAWPQLWELNQWVKDPHWIYPGDPLLVDDSKKPIAKGDGAAEVAVPQDVIQLPPDRRRIEGKQRDELGFGFQDFIQLPYLAPKGSDALFRELGALRITGTKHPERNHLADGEIVYLNGGQDKGLKAGDRFVILQVRKKRLFHPSDRQRRHSLGDVVQQVGVLRVTTVLPKGSVAILERCMDDVRVGDRVAPFTEPANIPVKLRTDITEPMPIKDRAVVIYARDNHGITGQGELVIIDKGSADGLQVGEMMIALRLRTFPVTEPINAPNAVMEKTNYVLGQMLVVKAGETTSTCRIVRSSEEIIIGDLVTR